MSDRDKRSSEDGDERGTGEKPANSAPDAVKDPNEKTDGKPGDPRQGGEADPGAG
jgi:hypothetical protein